MTAAEVRAAKRAARNVQFKYLGRGGYFVAWGVRRGRRLRL